MEPSDKEYNPANQETSSSPLKKISVLITDDYQVIREGLKRILEEDPEIEVIGEAENGVQGVEKAIQLKPDIVLMDIEMPEMNGIEATGLIKAQNSAIQVIMLTSFTADTYIVEAIRAGAVGYLLKNASKTLLLETIRGATAGQVLINSDMLREALTGLVNSSNKLRSSPGGNLIGQHLTEREMEVLKQVTEGLTNRQIGIKLSISEETVKKHIQSIIGKLGALDRTHAAVKAVRSGLVE